MLNVGGGLVSISVEYDGDCGAIIVLHGRIKLN